ncbi:MAG TPA: glycine--tRNA ligase subunit beta, partial [Syntrophus sp. (in: bacteria)]|nr:glycine--tRNA ligase subunit beta [Syntrophus sp. (in: bacteria)]
MGKELLLEIGTEEIPAAFLPKAMQDLEEMGRREFAACRLAHGAIRSLATPRRLCLVVGDLAERQEDLEVEKMGPARKAAFDAQGQPTKAALGFARGQGVELGDVGTVVTEKGEYLCVRKTIAGEPTEALLPEILPRLILGLPFKKSMRWSDLDIRFARPIRWLLALYGGRVVPFTLGNVRSGNLTQGHRFMSPEAFAVQDFADYLARTKERCVIVDPAERKAVIRQETRRAAAQVSGRALEDEALLEQVVFLTEYPTVVCGSFDRDYLRLPQEV